MSRGVSELAAAAALLAVALALAALFLASYRGELQRQQRPTPSPAVVAGEAWLAPGNSSTVYGYVVVEGLPNYWRADCLAVRVPGVGNLEVESWATTPATASATDVLRIDFVARSSQPLSPGTHIIVYDSVFDFFAVELEVKQP